VNFKNIPKFKNLRGKTAHNGWYEVYDPSVKTDIAIHHSLTEQGDSESFARYHVNNNGWPEIAYHFVILKDGTVEWNHDLGVKSFHVGNSNMQAVGVCLVGDFRYSEPTKEQKESLRNLHAALLKDLPNYKRTKGHNEFPGYEWKKCPEFDYEAVLSHDEPSASLKEEWKKGIQLQITDGSNPQGTPTREQVVAMIVRAMGK